MRTPPHRRAPPRALLALALLATAALGSPALASDPSAAEREALAERVSEYGETTRAQGVMGLIGIIPPTVIDAMAEDRGTTPDGVRMLMAIGMGQVLGSGTIVEFAMSPEDATWGETTNGTRYALVPTRTVIDVEGTGRMTTESRTLALAERGQWYLVRVSDPEQRRMLEAAHPGFADIQFPDPTITIADE